MTRLPKSGDGPVILPTNVIHAPSEKVRASRKPTTMGVGLGPKREPTACGRLDMPGEGCQSNSHPPLPAVLRLIERSSFIEVVQITSSTTEPSGYSNRAES